MHASSSTGIASQYIQYKQPGTCTLNAVHAVDRPGLTSQPLQAATVGGATLTLQYCAVSAAAQVGDK